MKKLLVPVLIAVLAGVGGGSGFSYMQVSKAYLADSLLRVDSLRAHPPEDDPEKHGAAPASQEHAADDIMTAEEALPMTPADSIRALAESRKPLRSATRDVADASGHGTREPDTRGATTPARATAPAGPPSTQHASDTAEAGDAHAPVRAPAPKPGAPGSSGASNAGSGAGGVSTSVVADRIREVRNDAMSTTLPEQRLAKIFAAMSAKDAAKVMEQMPDSDVRSILSLMSDRSAAAVLSQFPAARAAAITKGALKTSGGTP